MLKSNLGCCINSVLIFETAEVWCWLQAKSEWSVLRVLGSAETSQEKPWLFISIGFRKCTEWQFVPGFSFVLWFLLLRLVRQPHFGLLVRGNSKPFQRWDCDSLGDSWSEGELCSVEPRKVPGSNSWKARSLWCWPVLLYPDASRPLLF